MPPISPVCCQGLEVQQLTHQNDNSGGRSNNTEHEGAYNFNLEEFLTSSVGRQIEQNYLSKGEFSVDERDFLATSIVKNHLDNKTAMSLARIEKIAKDISKKFQGESEAYYFSRKPCVSGKLYTKYRSICRTYKKGFYSASVRSSKTSSIKSSLSLTTVQTPETSETTVDEEYQDSEDIAWLSNHSTPWTDVEDK